MWQVVQGRCRARDAAVSIVGQSQVLCSALRHLEEQFVYSCKRLRLERVNQGRLAEGGGRESGS